MDHMSDMDCSLCSSEAETINHLFLHCSWTTKLWYVCMDWWGVKWCSNKMIKDWFDGWMGLCPVPSLDMAADLVKFRIVWWFKFFGKNVSDLVSSLLLNVKDLCVEWSRVKKSVIKDWVHPLVDTFKFNVDGSARGSPGLVGIGGVLRDSYGKVLCMFSFCVGIMDSNNAELLAIKKAVGISCSEPSFRGRVISIVSDSMVAVSNKESPTSAPTITSGQ
ncbi:hypothetical protein Dsin_029854 [Dipteronia sinensis]|uniref:Reverse transcriptase zinc-binding domain-containing protein n=1 Tax=Dipteronia sinensis TaxID=43782 RepID=A0AAD9ZTD9_9ROSI|nr:hypothetical protein Dsin_029854 [Dipteronia sinensis]